MGIRACLTLHFFALSPCLGITISGQCRDRDEIFLKVRHCALYVFQNYLIHVGANDSLRSLSSYSSQLVTASRVGLT